MFGFSALGFVLTLYLSVMHTTVWCTQLGHRRQILSKLYHLCRPFSVVCVLVNLCFYFELCEHCLGSLNSSHDSPLKLLFIIFILWHLCQNILFFVQAEITLLEWNSVFSHFASLNSSQNWVFIHTRNANSMKSTWSLHALSALQINYDIRQCVKSTIN